MNWYCEKCKKLHTNDEMCPSIKLQLKNHPEWIPEAAIYVSVAA